MSVQSTLTTILQGDIFNPVKSDQESSFLTLIVNHAHNLPVRPLHLPLLFVPAPSIMYNSDYNCTRMTKSPGLGGMQGLQRRKNDSASNADAQASCVIVTLGETKKHYESIYQRLNRNKASFRVIDLFEKFVCIEDQTESAQKQIHSLTQTLNDSISNWDNVSKVIIDDFQILSFYYPLEEIIEFVRDLQKHSIHIIISMEKIIMNTDIHDILCGMSDTIVNIHGLDSGYSKDVHGIMQVSYSTYTKNNQVVVREKSLQYKVTDTEVKFFAKGFRGLF